MKSKNYVRGMSTYLAILLLIFAFIPLGHAEPDPGTDAESIGPSEVEMGSIIPHATETGKISLSVDGLGVYPGNSGTIQVEKPAGATVRKAYMAAATTGFRNHKLVTGDIQIDGVGVAWDVETSSSISSWNYWADVTSIVKSKIDSAPIGRVDFTITEPSADSYNIDGEILAVIFDDPNQATDNTIVLLFGAQAIGGDTFAIGLAEPIDTSDPNLVLDMSLGISYGYQLSGVQQYSIVNVNGDRLTTSAGGQDDAVVITMSNGALLTVGGLDDSNANPPNPYATPTTPRSDDELYNLIPSVSDGDTAITVYTQNPSNDDNIFFSSLYLASTTAVVGEGILLAPVSASNPVGSQHTVTATVQDDDGNPIVGRDVTFTIVLGPHTGQTSTVSTDANGEATFTYTGTTTGTDVIEATMVDSQGNPVTSNQATKDWYSVGIVTVESADVSGATKDVFQLGESVYAIGSGYAPSTIYDLYVVEDTTWTDGMPIPPRVVGTETSVTTDAFGNIPAGTLIWGAAVEGLYDIVVDVSGEGDYDAATDALDANIDVGFETIPEFPTVALPVAAIIGLMFLFQRRKD